MRRRATVPPRLTWFSLTSLKSVAFWAMPSRMALDQARKLRTGAGAGGASLRGAGRLGAEGRLGVEGGGGRLTGVVGAITTKTASARPPPASAVLMKTGDVVAPVPASGTSLGSHPFGKEKAYAPSGATHRSSSIEPAAGVAAAGLAAGGS